MRRNLPILRPGVSNTGTGSFGPVGEENLDSQEDRSQPSKRRRTDTRASFARRRAVTACESCRSRKTKCDNERPICGACASRNATCVFRDQQSDHSTFDSASLAILDRVNYAIQLLESGSAPVATHDHAPSLSGSGVEDDFQEEIGQAQGDIPSQAKGLRVNDGGASATWSFSAEATTEAALNDALNITSGSSSTNILDWPIFEGVRFNHENIKPAIKSSVPDLQRGRIHEGEVLGLVESFLRNVHTKNPVLDPINLLGLTRDVAEQGFAWDGASCLVLICSALGRIATPWDMTTPAQNEHSQSDSSRLQIAEAYYTAARKRLGLLDTSITATQCCFLTGVYEMYAMRPLTSWSSFNRACTMLQLHLFAQPEGDGSFTRREQCLYWSALKSECEVREELALPPSGLALVGYPGGFPSPPGSADAASMVDLGTPTSANSSRTASWDLLHEHSWYYYLSDIAYRRIANRATTMLYSRPKHEWMSMPVEALYRTCDELDKQTLQWWDNIPGSPSANLTAEAEVDELTYMLWLNYVDLREKIWRPFAYIAIHANLSCHLEMSLASHPAGSSVPGNAAKCLDMCAQTLQGARLKHRHHGLWLTVRCMFSKAMLLIAAARTKRLELDVDWETRVREFQDYLAYWEEEAPDCKGMWEALELLRHGGATLPV